MAKSKNNVITHGLSGKIGDILVFSTRGGKTIVSKVPKKSTKPPTAAQKQQIKKFQQAIFYAKAANADAATKAAYAEKTPEGKSAFNIAVADMLHAPEIESVDFSNYKGKVGDTIIIRATDDFMVAQVTVTINNADGTLVETGNATLDNKGNWVFKAKVANASLAGDKITVQASDAPGNITKKQDTLS